MLFQSPGKLSKNDPEIHPKVPQIRLRTQSVLSIGLMVPWSPSCQKDPQSPKIKNEGTRPAKQQFETKKLIAYASGVPAIRQNDLESIIQKSASHHTQRNF